jgi:hypothetical protein
MTKKKRARKTRPARRKALSRRSKPARKKKAVRSTKRSRPRQVARTTRRSPLDRSFDAPVLRRHGLGARSAGQSGDTQGLSNAVDVDSESVEELIEEGQSFEAGVVAGVEDADSRQGEVRSTQVREDDVPLEYFEKD